MPQAIKNAYHLLVAVLAIIFFRYPAKRMTVIGVTGTDGKTTTVNLIYEILRAAGKKASMVSSVGAKIGGGDYQLPFHVTTPSPWQLQKFFRMALDRGEEYMVLEVTSHGLDQNRIFGCNLSVGVITNITHEHLDYHQTFERYLSVKSRLFYGVKYAILNREDVSFKFLKSIIKDKQSKTVTYGLKAGNVTLASFPFKTPLPGEYNQYNALAAVAVAKVLKIPDLKIRQVLANFNGVAGRYEFIKTGRDFKVLIDFAHTPNALESLLSTVKPKVLGRLIHIFGSAGLRDRLKRPKMGEISSRYAKVIILTEEDYRCEDLNKIIDDLASKIPKGKEIYRIPDRKAAIEFALKMARKEDWIVLTGKGHEKSLCRGKVEYPWDERQAVETSLAELDKNCS